MGSSGVEQSQLINGIQHLGYFDRFVQGVHAITAFFMSFIYEVKEGETWRDFYNEFWTGERTVKVLSRPGPIGEDLTNTSSQSANNNPTSNAENSGLSVPATPSVPAEVSDSRAETTKGDKGLTDGLAETLGRIDQVARETGLVPLDERADAPEKAAMTAKHEDSMEVWTAEAFGTAYLQQEILASPVMHQTTTYEVSAISTVEIRSDDKAALSVTRSNGKLTGLTQRGEQEIDEASTASLSPYRTPVKYSAIGETSEWRNLSELMGRIKNTCETTSFDNYSESWNELTRDDHEINQLLASIRPLLSNERNKRNVTRIKRLCDRVLTRIDQLNNEEITVSKFSLSP